MNHYPHHIGDYIKDTAHLGPLEDGIYRRMLDLYYTLEGPLERELERLCRRIRVDFKRFGKIVQALLSEFFELAEEGWRHSRCEIEIAKYQAKADANRTNGGKGGRPKRTQPPPPQKPNGLFLGSDSLTENNLNQNQNQNQSPPTPSGEFEEFWKTWPAGTRKAAKGKCYEAWKKANLDARISEIMPHLTAIKKSEEWRSGYDPAPLVYLNQRRWEGADLPQSQGPNW